MTMYESNCFDHNVNEIMLKMIDTHDYKILIIINHTIEFDIH